LFKIRFCRNKGKGNVEVVVWEECLVPKRNRGVRNAKKPCLYVVSVYMIASSKLFFLF